MWLAFSLLSACETPPPCVADVDVWEDLDGDGFGAIPLDPVCTPAEGQATEPLDCDDTNPDVGPGAKERCNGIDDDCDGSLDEDFERELWYADQDGDGFGDRYPSQLACDPPGDGWSRNANDCDDDDAAVHPDAQEVCGGGDEDCDGAADDLDESVDPGSFDRFFRDADLDGYGDPDRASRACLAPSGFVPNRDDCDDDDPTFTQNLYYTDGDGDGFGDASQPVAACARPAGASVNRDDCDDTDPLVTDERDWYEDADLDGWGEGPSVGFGCFPPGGDFDLAPVAGDCDASDPDENPGILEDCHDGVDQNCDGQLDCDDDDCASDPICVPPCADDVLSGGRPISVVGSTTGQGNDQSGTCGGGSAADVVFHWVPDLTGPVQIDLEGSLYDTVLVVKQGCGGVQLACDDDSGLGLTSLVNVNVTAGVPVIIIVDGYGNGSGTFTLNVR